MSEITDLRSYLSELEALGDIERISREVDPKLEAAAVTRLSTERRRPAPFFENISGVAQGFRMIGAPGALFSSPRHPLAKGTSRESPRKSSGSCARRGFRSPRPGCRSAPPASGR